VLRSGWLVARDSLHIPLEGAPASLAPEAVRANPVEADEGVGDARHIHAWSISLERPMITLNVRLTEAADATLVVAAVKSRLLERFGVGHATVEVDFGTTGR
jgi:cobalt-zinc-cadmium efflux system protein